MKLARPLIYLVAAVILIPIYVGAAGMITARALGLRTVTVNSSSMSPAISKGDALIIQSVNNPKIVVGDLVTFKLEDKSGTIVTHRLTRVSSRFLLTKGDANKLPDKPIQRTQIVGLPILLLPGFGTILETLKKPLTIFLLIYLPSLFLILLEIYGLIDQAGHKNYLIDYSYAKKRQKA